MINVRRVVDVREVNIAIDQILEERSELLPKSADALILIKPNLNNDLNALTGNSTDLRVLTALVKGLIHRGFRNIIIGDGCNVGVHRKGINVISRLKIDRLADQFGIKAVDLNDTHGPHILLAHGQPARVSQLCFDAELFINLPTIKTHEEVQLSCACKNLVGCLAGGSEKKKIHAAGRNLLARNLIALNTAIHPHLHIVDGLMTMEGRGPGDGMPRNLGILVDSTDPFLADAVVAHLVGFSTGEVPYLALARQQGFLSEKIYRLIESLPCIASLQKAPPRKLVTRLLGHNLFISFRDLVRPWFDNRVVIPLLYRWKIIQDIYERDDDKITLVKKDDGARCLTCVEQTCNRFCPAALPVDTLKRPLASTGCMGCIYCFLVCPHDAFHMAGELGYLSRHLDKYRKHIMNEANTNIPDTGLKILRLNGDH
jgi:uncharacterized protein (DUF362 family)/ferredoxin-like protein FixX